MGQARARGTQQERIAAAVESAKVNPPKPKKLNKGQQRALATGLVMEYAAKMFGGALFK